jgi:hypothetical protein
MTALEAGARRRRNSSLVAVGLLGATVAGGVGAAVMGLSLNVVAMVVLWPLLGALIALRLGGRLPPSLCAGLILVVTVADLGLVGSTLYIVRPASEVLAEGEAAAAWLAHRPGRFRVYSPSYSIPHHTGAVYGIESADGVDPFQLADYVDFARAATGVDLPGYSVTVPAYPEVPQGEDMLEAHRDVVPDLSLLGLLNVRYLAASYPMEAEDLTPLVIRDGVHLYQNEKALPRAFVTDGVQGPWDTTEVHEANVVKWTPNRIRVEAQGPGLLVLSEVYDPDWSVQVDGAPSKLLRAGEILRAVPLADGAHQVVFAYRPAGLGFGLGATIAGWLCVCGLSIVAWRRRGSAAGTFGDGDAQGRVAP